MPIATATTTAPAIMSHFLSDGFDDFFFLDVLFFVIFLQKLYSKQIYTFFRYRRDNTAIIIVKL